MNKITKKIIIGFLFAFVAIIVNILMKYYQNLGTGIQNNLEEIGFNFIIFFLIGYVILGNLLATKKAN